MLHALQGRTSKTSHIVNTHYTRTSPFAPLPTLGMVLTERLSADEDTLKKAARDSAPSLSSAEGATSDAAESVLRCAQVRVAGITTQENHCVYQLEVKTRNGVPHVVEKRFSEIHDFRAQLLTIGNEKKSNCGNGPCAQLSELTHVDFPRRQLRLPGFKTRHETDMEVAQERATVLERFLQAVLRVYRKSPRRKLRVCTNSQCAALDIIQRFLELEVAEANVRGCVPMASDPVHEAHTMARVQLAEVILPGEAHSFPDLAFSTLSGDRPTTLDPIDEIIIESAVI